MLDFMCKKLLTSALSMEVKLAYLIRCPTLRDALRHIRVMGTSHKLLFWLVNFSSYNPTVPHVVERSYIVLLRSHFFQSRSISIRFLKKIAISIGFDFHTGPAGRSVGRRAKYFRRAVWHPISCPCQTLGCIRWRHEWDGVDKSASYRVVATRDWRLITPWKLVWSWFCLSFHTVIL